MSDFDNIFNDPRFPKRPQHPDFWKLSEIVTQLDGMQEDGDIDFASVIGTEIDEESLAYMIQQRCLIVLKQLGLPEQLFPALGAAYMEAFIVGCRYNQRKGSK